MLGPNVRYVAELEHPASMFLAAFCETHLRGNALVNEISCKEVDNTYLALSDYS